ncbi:K+/H+ antiporter subunit F [Devosia neptuniae]|jgi:multicomponent K+:H+ antiporter subunit F|uniref:K+/H+ antiporter subunit F n=1 Tax=Devosia neptuniae TaxID=191302 RepID=A0ABY6CHQ6_9HYPH|nr:K+/H+ antiporter subunit F [Devosia neptuniae]UXN70827.1 K+/H+ antiporter subunit F [Devosia neptuniae]
MSAAILFWTLTTAQVMLALAMVATIYRVIKGPRAQDRIVSLDALYVNAMLLLVVFGIRYGTSVYFEVALIISLLGFVGTVALAKFLMRGEVIE